jgi:hypothetical protein
MEKKLNNLLSLTDFRTGWRANQASKTKRTETGLDILKEGLEDGIEEIISEGPEGAQDEISYKDTDTDNIISKLEDLNEDAIDEIVNYLRDILLEMEQQGFVDEDTTDRIDEETDGDWIAWIDEVISLPDFPEEGLNGILDIISTQEGDEFSSDDEDVECPDCDGSGEVDGEECERCDGSGRVYRPDDIPPDNY